MIRFDHVSKQYPGGQEALAGVEMEVDEGEMVFVTGHSGAGKSTLLRLIACLERASRGQVLVDGRNLTKLPRRRIPFHRRRIGMVFQDHRLLTDRTVFDNVALPMTIAGFGRHEAARRVRAALDQVGLLHRERALPSMLSAGEQQRVGIARAVVAKPPLLLADEPTGNLDHGLATEIMGLFERFNELGMTLLVASHDLPLVRRLRKRVLVLDQGRLVDDFRPEPAAHG